MAITRELLPAHQLFLYNDDVLFVLSGTRRVLLPRTVFNPNLVKESYVISRYIDNPLLMGGKKFDLR